MPGFIVNIIQSHGYIYTFLYMQPWRIFLQYLSTKSDRWNSQLSHFMLRKMITASSTYLFAKKYNFFVSKIYYADMYV